MTTVACNRTGDIHRYHDGELPDPDRRIIESHLQDCPECRQLLSELQHLSALITGAVTTEAPPALVPRLHECWSAGRDRSVLRLAGWLTGAAAAVLIVALLSKGFGRTNLAAQPPFWEAVAVTPPSEQPEEASPELVVAQWMAEDLSAENGGLR